MCIFRTADNTMCTESCSGLSCCLRFFSLWSIIIEKHQKTRKCEPCACGTQVQVITRNGFPNYWPFVGGIHRSRRRIPTQRASNSELWCFLCQTDQQTFELLLICYAMSLTWRHCNGHILSSVIPYNTTVTYFSQASDDHLPFPQHLDYGHYSQMYGKWQHTNLQAAGNGLPAENITHVSIYMNISYIYSIGSDDKCETTLYYGKAFYFPDISRTTLK